MKKTLFIFLFLVSGHLYAQSIGYDSTYNNLWLKEPGGIFSGGLTNEGNRLGYNTVIGYQSGNSNVSGTGNTYLGAFSGMSVTTGFSNTIVGSAAGSSLTTGNENVFVGNNTGGTLITGSNNVLIGKVSTGMDYFSNTVGIGTNVHLGNQAIGIGNQAASHGENSISIGSNSFSAGLNSVALGANARVDQENTIVLGGIEGLGGSTVNTKVGIGTNTPRSELEVKGKLIVGDSITSLPGGYNMYVSQGILTEALTLGVKNTGDWADFVFDKDYKLRPLRELKEYIEQNKHLPEIPSTAEVMKNGINVGVIEAKLLQKIEELTLYIIQQEERIQALENRK